MTLLELMVEKGKKNIWGWAKAARWAKGRKDVVAWRIIDEYDVDFVANISGEKVTKEQYEAALKKKLEVIDERRPITEPSCDGVGLPPVGCECEVKVGGDNYNLCRIVYSDSNAGVAFVYLGGDDEKYCGTIDCVTAGAAYGYFRPIRSEADKKRGAVIHEIAEAMVAPQPKGNGILAQAISVYNKIASGKIPGVKLED